MKMPRQLSFRQALAWICVITLLVSGSFGAGVFYWRMLKQKRTADPRYTIVAILQSCDSSEPLPTDYLAELLNLSVDKPTNLYRFSAKDAEQKLLSCPVIKSAEVKKIAPGMIYIKYALRRPIAYLADYSNAGVNEEGLIFPVNPFYTPKNIPELVLGLPAGISWGAKIHPDQLTLSRTIMQQASSSDSGFHCRLKRVDISQAFSQRFGLREIVLCYEHCLGTLENLQVTLRLAPDNWQQQLRRYHQLAPKLGPKDRRGQSAGVYNYTIDMRLSQLAFILEE